MACTCHIDVDRRLGIVTLYDSVDAKQLLRALGDLYQHPAWRLGFRALWDATGVFQLLVDPDDLALIVRRSEDMRPLIGSGRSAIVVPRETDYVIAKLLIQRVPSAQRERMAFRRLEDAQAWLLDDDTEAD